MAMNELCSRWSSRTKKLVWALFLGQVVSLMFALASLSSSLISDLGADAPLFQTLCTYVLLAVFCGGIMLYRRQRLLVPWYWYLPLGFVDCQANFFFNKAFQYTSITTVTLLNCFTIAWVIGLTWIFLGTRYSLWQLFGAAICVLGLGLVLLSDDGSSGGGGSRPLLGDILIICATVFFAMSNVGEEFFVKRKDIVEVLTMLGIFGALVSTCEICIFEIKSIGSITWSTDIILAICGYALSAFLFYVFVPHVMQSSGAAFFNLSLLTADMWAVIFRIIFYGQEVHWLYYLSFGIVAVGLVIYTITGKDPDPIPVNTDDAEYQPIDVEGVNGDLGHRLIIGNTST